jgi:hypothetical protein
MRGAGQPAPLIGHGNPEAISGIAVRIPRAGGYFAILCV